MDSKWKIMIVDDDADILAGMRRMLRRQAPVWDLFFCSSGPEAVTVLGQHSIDLVVTDMKMPGMSGAELLTIVAMRYPAIIRFVLSGQADQGVVDNSIHLIHQFLDKPISSDVLIDHIARALGESKRDEIRIRLNNFVAKLSSLPSPPQSYVKLCKCLDEPSCSFEAVAHIISADAAASAKLLQLVNSSFIGIGRPISDSLTAIRLLGVETVKQLALVAGVFRASPGTSNRIAKLIDHEWDHSLKCAAMAGALVWQSTHSQSAKLEASTAGLLHDIGKLIMLEVDTSEYLDLLAIVDHSARPLTEMELTHYGFHHGHIGAHLLNLWGLPIAVVNAVSQHHDDLPLVASTVDSMLGVNLASIIVEKGRLPDHTCWSFINEQVATTQLNI